MKKTLSFITALMLLTSPVSSFVESTKIYANEKILEREKKSETVISTNDKITGYKKLSVDVVDINNKNLENFEFLLKGNDLEKTFNGNFNIENIKKGFYKLFQSKADKNYLKSEDIFSLYSDDNGNMVYKKDNFNEVEKLESKNTNVNSKLEVINYDLKVLDGENFKSVIKLKKIKDIKEGDTFVIESDRKLIPKNLRNILNSDGETVAIARYFSSVNKIEYTFTKAMENIDYIDFDVAFLMDKNLIHSDKSYTFINTVAGAKQSPKIFDFNKLTSGKKLEFNLESKSIKYSLILDEKIKEDKVLDFVSGTPAVEFNKDNSRLYIYSDNQDGQELKRVTEKYISYTKDEKGSHLKVNIDKSELEKSKLLIQLDVDLDISKLFLKDILEIGDAFENENSENIKFEKINIKEELEKEKGKINFVNYKSFEGKDAEKEPVNKAQDKEEKSIYSKEEQKDTWELLLNDEVVEKLLESFSNPYSQKETDDDYLKLLSLKFIYADGSVKVLNYDDIKKDASIKIKKKEFLTGEKVWTISKSGFETLTFNPISKVLENAGMVSETPKKATLNIFKYLQEGNQKKPLANIDFEIMGNLDKKELPIVISKTSGADGIITFSDLEIPSQWYLNEKTVPVEYEAPANQWIVHILKPEDADSEEIKQQGYKIKIYKAPITPIVKTEVSKNNPKLQVDAVTKATIMPSNLQHYLDTSNGKKFDDYLVQTVKKENKEFLEIENKRRDLKGKGEVVVTKVDEDNKSLKLEGATFDLRDETREKVINTVSTDNEGRAVFTGLEKGIYYLREIRSPYAYNLDDHEWKVVVDEKGHTKVYQTGGNSKLGLLSSQQLDVSDQNFNNKMRTRIFDVNYETGDFTLVAYVNVDGQQFENVGHRRPYNPQVYIDIPTNSGVLSLKGYGQYVNPGTVPVNVRPVELQHHDVSSVEQGKRISFDFGENLDYYKYYNGYNNLINEKKAVILKVNGKFDRNSDKPIELLINFKSSESKYESYGYYSNIFDYLSTAKYKLEKPNINHNEDILLEDIAIHENIFNFEVTNKKAIKANGSFYIDKTDGSKYLKGAEFFLAKEDEIGDIKKRRFITVDKEGRLEVPNVPMGKYILKEFKAPEGYKLSDDVWDVIVDFYGNTTVSKRDGEKGNEKFTGNVVDRNKDEYIENLAPFIEFNPEYMRVFNAALNDYEPIPIPEAINGEFNFYAKVYGKDMTTKFSVINSINLRLRKISPNYQRFEKTFVSGDRIQFGNLDKGVYILETLGEPKTTYNSEEKIFKPMNIIFEVKEENGAKSISVRDADVEYSLGQNFVEITLKDLSLRKGYAHIVNEQTALEIKKVEKDKPEKTLSDATFELYEEKTLENGNKEKIKTNINAVSGKDGTAELKGLKAGVSYYIKEISAPVGYVAEDKFYGAYVLDEYGKVNLLREDGSKENVATPIVVENSPVIRKGKIIVSKKDEKGKSLNGADFTIYKSDDNWNKGAELKEVLKDSNGTTFTFKDLEKGKYIVKETKSPSGYIKSKIDIKVEVKEDGETVVVNKNEFKTNFDKEFRNMAVVSRVESRNILTENYTEEMYADTVTPRTNRNVLNSFTEKLGILAVNNSLPVSEKADDILGLYQIYEDHEEPTGYKTDNTGNYPFPTSQSGEEIRNANIPEAGLYWYDSVYRQPDNLYPGGFRPARNLPAAGVNKYATETEIDGEFNIDLKVEGNLVNPDERVDVMIVYDNSNSMNEIGASGKRRFDVAKEAVTKFINDVLSSENNPKGYIKMGLVTYASNVFDGTIKTSNFNNSSRKLPDYSYMDFTDNAKTLIDKLPKDIPNNEGFQGFGGTFTSAALQRADKIFVEKSPNNHKKVVINVTDGIPTKSLVVKKVENGLATEFAGETENEKGDGSNYYLEEYQNWSVDYTVRFIDYYHYYGLSNNRRFVGSHDEVLEKIRELNEKKNSGETIFIDTQYSGKVKARVESVGNAVRGPANPYKYRPYTVNGMTIKDHGFVTKSYAKKMMNSGIEIFNLGIELADTKFQTTYRPDKTTKEQALELMKSMSSQDGKGHYYDVDKVEKLSTTFKDIFRKLPQRTVYKADVEDPMGTMVDLKIDVDTLNKLMIEKRQIGNETIDYRVLYDGRDGKSAFSEGVKDLALLSSQDVIKEDVLVLYDPVSRTLKLENFTLGESDWIKLSYRVKLRTEDPNYIENFYYPTNGETFLKPNIDFNTRWQFPRPSVRGPMKSIFVEKEWLDSDGNKSDAGKSSIRVKLQFRKIGEENWQDVKYSNYPNNDKVMIMTLNKENSWKGKFVNLLEYDNTGKHYEYRVVEEKVDGYDSSIIMKDTHNKVVDTILGGKGIAKIVNTELKAIKVKKIWKPEEAVTDSVKVNLEVYKKGVKLTNDELVQLGLIEDKISRNITKNDNWEIIFENLPLRTKDGSKLTYRVVEENIEGFEVDYRYNPDTNTNEVINYKTPIVFVENKPNEIKFRKVKEDKTDLTGATLELKKENVGEYIKKTEGTDPEFVFKRLESGSYELWETKAPNGYVKPTESVAKFSVNADGEIENISGNEKYLDTSGGVNKVINENAPMKLILSKSDGTNIIKDGKVKFELYNAGNDKVVKDISLEFDLNTQTEAGFIVDIPNNLNSGNYYLKEIKSPYGYILSSNKYYFNINWNEAIIKLMKIEAKDGTLKQYKGQNIPQDGIVLYKNGSEPIKFEIVNRKAVFPKTGGHGTFIYLVVGTVLMMISLIFIRKNKKYFKINF